jgi:phospholipase C
MLVISPYSKVNSVDHNLSDQASIINFVEYNWRLPGIPGSADRILAARDQQVGLPFDLAGMFDFGTSHSSPLILGPVTGQPR